MAQTVSIATQAGPVGLTTVFWLNGADDDYTTAAQVLSERGVRLARLRQADELLRRLEPAEHALCVIDLASGSGDGQALRAIRKRDPRALVVGIIDPRRREGALEAFQKGVFDVLSEPVSALDFASVVRNADEFLSLADPTADDSSTSEVAGLVLASVAMRRLMELVHRVGMARCHVMIAGEFGTGEGDSGPPPSRLERSLGGSLCQARLQRCVVPRVERRAVRTGGRRRVAEPG